MSYGTDVVDMFRQVGIYAGTILKGTKPADAGAAGDQIPVRHQLENGAGPRHRGATGTTCDRRRGDRIGRCMSAEGQKRT